MNPTEYGLAESFDGIILNVQKHPSGTRLITVFTLQTGRVRVFASGGGRKRKNGNPFFQFARIAFEARRKDNTYTMGEYECRNAKALMNLDWNTMHIHKFWRKSLPPYFRRESGMKRYISC